MKKIYSNNRVPWLICAIGACACVFTGVSMVSKSQSIDTTNPSKLSKSDYRNGTKRAADAAKRVKYRLKSEMSKKGVSMGSEVFIRVFKQSRVFEVWLLNKQTKRYEEFKSYRIKGMSGVIGPKTYEGDMQAPEGFYNVGKRALNPQSRFHLSFNLGYPNAYDKAHARTGHSLMVHGNRVSAGCLAMSDYYIEEIYTLCAEALKHGQKRISVHSFPFKMTKENMKKNSGHKWYGFWKNLKPGYDVFEKTKVPPSVKVYRKKYIFGSLKNAQK